MSICILIIYPLIDRSSSIRYLLSIICVHVHTHVIINVSINQSTDYECISYFLTFDSLSITQKHHTAVTEAKQTAFEARAVEAHLNGTDLPPQLGM